MAKRRNVSEQHTKTMVEKILNFLSSNKNIAFNYKEVTEGIGYKSKKDREEVQDILYALMASGKLHETQLGRFRIPSNDKASRVVGTVDMIASGGAYVIPEDKEGLPNDIYVNPGSVNGAMHGDKVEVAIYDHRGGHKPEGEIVRVIKRMRETFVGVLDVKETMAFLVCNPRQTGGRDIYVPKEALNGGRHGQKAVVRITEWPSNAKNPQGEVITVLGDMGDNQTEMHAILAEYGLPYSYPDEVAAEAEKINAGITKQEVASRIDMRGVTTFTIDPSDAKDFDDALSILRLDNGHWEVGIHIADVTHYVSPGSIIDNEGYSRATSVYLVDRVVPMLPERLSNFLCSLRPDEDKLTFSVIVEMDDEAQILKSQIAKTVIRSNRRFTYEEAQAIIEGADGDYRYEVLKLNELAQKVRTHRFENGAIGFERAEPRFNIDAEGHPLSVYFKEAKESNMLVEEFMLIANKRVAEYIGNDEINTTERKRTPKTFVYRVHDKPSEDRYAKFATFIRRFGYEAMPKKDEQINNAVNRIIKECKGKGEQNLVETLALRTMAKAVYSTKNLGHYGLAFPFYTHFTSPIRRYPDMMVHRLLFSYMNGGRSVNAELYEEKCAHCSEREVLAAEAERDSIKYKQAEYLLDHLGEDFDATISGVTEWGIYAQIDENMCEGMISLRDLDDDTYLFDDDNYCVIGRNTGHRYQLGQQIRVRIANANLEKKQIDMVLSGSPLTDIEKQNKKILASGDSIIERQRAAALSHVGNFNGGSNHKGGKGGKHGQRSSGGIPQKSVLQKRKGKKEGKTRKERKGRRR